MPSGSRSFKFSVAVSRNNSSAYKAYEICHFVGLKKANAIVCVFYNKPGTAQVGAISKAQK